MEPADLSATVRDFLSAFVSEVLAIRGLYSPELFERRRVLGIVAARRARHPGLRAYIDAAVGAMVDPLIRGDIGKVAVLILDANGVLLERFVADLKVQAEILASVEPEDVESALRSALLKLQRAGEGVAGVGGDDEEDDLFVVGGTAAGGALRPLPKGCTFEVVAHARSRKILPQESWIDADPVAAAAAAAAERRKRSDGGGGNTCPSSPLRDEDEDDKDAEKSNDCLSHLLPPRGVLALKSCRAGGGALRLQLYVECTAT